MLISVGSCTSNLVPQLMARMAMCTSAILATSTISHVRWVSTRFHQSNHFSELFLDGLRELGIPILTDPNNGTAAGGMLIPDSINPDNQTRSYARLDYFDTVINTRQNLHVATHQHVTRVLIDAPHNVRLRNYSAGLWVSGVEVWVFPFAKAFLMIESSWPMEALLSTTFHAQEKWSFPLELFILPKYLSFLELAIQVFFPSSVSQ